MPSPAYTYVLTNGTTADASQVTQNFNDILNGVTDGTKDLSISALTCAGTATLNGNINLGNASGDDLTITASLASSIAIKTTNSFNIGSSTLGLASIYFGANSQTVRILPSASMSATWTLTLPVTAGTANYFLKTDGAGVTSWAANSSATATLSGATTSPTVTVKYVVIGDMAFCTIVPFGSVTKSGAGAFSLPTILPAGVRPLSNDKFQLANINKGGTYTNIILIIGTGGTIDFYGDSAGNNFTDTTVMTLNGTISFFFPIA